MSFFGNRRQVEQQPVSPPADEQPQPLPRPSIPQSPLGFETVLGANSVMEGVFRSSANVRLDGTFTGTLEITGNVLVGETAKINADINAKNISIAGAVRGNVSGKKVQLLRTGRIWGDIRATALTTEEGAFIDGKITMISHEAQSPPADLVDSEGDADQSEGNLTAILPGEYPEANDIVESEISDFDEVHSDVGDVDNGDPSDESDDDKTVAG